MNLFMNKVEAERIEASITEAEGEFWLTLIDWSMKPIGERKPGIATDSRFTHIPAPRVNEITMAVYRIMESR